MSKKEKEKKQLIKHIKQDQCEAEEIAAAIKDGVVDLLELQSEATEGHFYPTLEKQVNDILNGRAPTPLHSTQQTLSDDCTAERPWREPTQADAPSEEIPSDVPQDEDTEICWPEDEPEQGEIVQSVAVGSAAEPAAQTAKAHSNKGMFKRPFSFRGRIRRLEYGITIIVVSLWMSFLSSIGEEVDYSLVWAVIYLLACWICFAQGCKRCHDQGRSGWWQLIPFFGFILLFVEGDQGENEYGDDPKH